jgi:hypothetical protein
MVKPIDSTMHLRQDKGMTTNRLTVALRKMDTDELVEWLRDTDPESQLYWKINRALQGRDWWWIKPLSRSP